MDGRRRRKSGKHAGVVVTSRTLPSGAVSWRARWIDPDTGKLAWETLPKTLTTEDQRAAWAAKKAEEIAARARSIGEGSPTKKNLSLAEVVERYFSDVGAGLRPNTLDAYRCATNALTAWAANHGIHGGDDLRPEHLLSFRAHLVNRPRRGHAAGAARGKRKDSGKRKPTSVNHDLRGLKTFLDYVRRLGLVPFITRDSIEENLKNVEEPKPIPAFMSTSNLLKLIEAVKRHDEDTFALTREEKERGVPKGSTPRFPPILSYVAVVLLTGMREGEARSVTWDLVDLNAAPAGTIQLTPEITKTKQGRLVDLIVSPVLQELFAALKLKAGEAHHVFDLTRDVVEAARKRLVRTFGAPKFTWQQLRVTCGTYLANAPGIFGAASTLRESRQLGHSITIAEKHYLGVVHIDPNAKSLEAAMAIEAKLREALGLGLTKKGTKKATAS